MAPRGKTLRRAAGRRNRSAAFVGGVLRPATHKDLDALLAVEAACFGDRRYSPETVAWILGDPSTATVVDDRGGIVGSISVHLGPDAGRILSVAVLPEWRRKGLGRALMAAAERLAREAGVATIRLEVGVRNRGALQFYRTLGYKIEGVLPAYYRDGEDGYAMAKPLDGNA